MVISNALITPAGTVPLPVLVLVLVLVPVGMGVVEVAVPPPHEKNVVTTKSNDISASADKTLLAAICYLPENHTVWIILL
jgi:hypothetical protein